MLLNLQECVRYMETVSLLTKKLTEIMRTTGWKGEAELLKQANLRLPKKDAQRGKLFEEVFYKGVVQVKSGRFFSLLDALSNESVLLILETENLIRDVDKTSYNQDILETTLERLIVMHERFHGRTDATIMLSAIIHGAVWKTKATPPAHKVKQ